MLEHLKPNTLEAICECVINNIINKNIKMSDQEEKKINKSWDKIWELINLTASQKKGKEI